MKKIVLTDQFASLVVDGVVRNVFIPKPCSDYSVTEEIEVYPENGEEPIGSVFVLSIMHSQKETLWKYGATDSMVPWRDFVEIFKGVNTGTLITFYMPCRYTKIITKENK